MKIANFGRNAWSGWPSGWDWIAPT